MLPHSTTALPSVTVPETGDSTVSSHCIEYKTDFGGPSNTIAFGTNNYVGIADMPVVKDDGFQYFTYKPQSQPLMPKAGQPKRRRANRQKVVEPLHMSDEQKEQNAADIAAAMNIKPQSGRTHLVAVVIDNAPKDNNNNTQRTVSCDHGLAFNRGYPYDQNKDAYLITCVQSQYLGYIPCAYQVEMPGTGWRCNIPVPDSVVNRMMSAAMASKLASIRESFHSDRYEIQIVQMAGCEL